MVSHNPLKLAAELRARAVNALPGEREELLFLAREYERVSASPAWGQLPAPRVSLPR